MVVASRFALEQTLGRPLGVDMCALHHCDNGAGGCVNPWHLFEGTRQDNVADMVAKDRQARGHTSGARLHPDSVLRGEQRPQAKLTGRDVATIRFAAAQGARGIELAMRFGISKGQVSRIVRGERWRHLPIEAKAKEQLNG